MYTKRYLALVMALVMVFSLVVPASAVEKLAQAGNETAKLTVSANVTGNSTKDAAVGTIFSNMNAQLVLYYGNYLAQNTVNIVGQTKTHANQTTLSLGGNEGDGINFSEANIEIYFPGLTRLNKSEGYDIKFVDALGTTNTEWNYNFKRNVASGTDGYVTLTLAVNTSKSDPAEVDGYWDELKREAFTVSHDNPQEDSYIKLATGSYLQMANEKLTVVNSSGLMLDDFSSETSVDTNISNAKTSLTYTTPGGDPVYQLLLKKGTKFSFGASIATVKEDLLVTMSNVTKEYTDPILGNVHDNLDTSSEEALAESLLKVFSEIAGLARPGDNNPVVITFGKPYTATNSTVDEQSGTTTDTSTAITVDTTQNGNETPTTTVNITTQVTTTTTGDNPESNTTTTTKSVTVDTDIQPIVPVNPTYSTNNETVIEDATTAVYSLTTNEATFRAALEANGESSKENVLQTAAAANAIAEAAAKLTAAETGAVTKAKVVLKTELTNVTAADNVVASVTYDIKPVAQLYINDDVVATEVLDNEDIEDGQTFTFNIPVPASMTATQIKVTHEGEFLGTFTPTGSPGGVRYVTVTVSHFSMFELEPVVTESSSLDVIYTLDLASEISINLYVKGTLADNTTSTADYTIYYGPTGVEHQSTLSKTTWLANSGYYKIVIGTFHAKQMGDEIKVIIKDGDDQVFEKVYSIKSYCNSVIDNAGSGDKLKNLCKAVLDYGAYSQLYFKHNTDYLVNGGNYTISLPETIEPAYMGTDGDFNGVTALKTLDLKSQVELIFYFRSNSNESITVDSVTTDNSNFTGWTKSTTPLDGGYTKVAISGIPSRYLNEKFNVTVTCGGQTGTWSWSAMSFAYATQNSETVGNVVKALFNYYTYADAYFKK